MKRNLALDGMRGIAILAVLISHASALGVGKVIYFSPLLVSGWSGVDLFFVLSGYLITGILLRTKNSSNRVVSFYMRRILRIFPLYYFALLTVLILGYSIPSFGTQTTDAWANRLPYCFYIQNLMVLWKGHPTITAFGPFWSLAVEEQFYLIWPLLTWWLGRVALLRLSIVACVLSLALRVALVLHFGPRFWIFVFSPCRGDGLIMGSIIAIVSVSGERPSRKLITWMGSAGTALLLFILVADRHEFAHTDAGPYMYTIGVTGFSLLFASLVALTHYRLRFLSKLLELSVLRNVGKYSYGMYVVHYPLFLVIYPLVGKFTPMKLAPALGTISLMCITTYLLARLTYFTLESPFLRMKDKFRPRSENERVRPSDCLIESGLST